MRQMEFKELNTFLIGVKMRKVLSLSGESQTGKDSLAAPLIAQGWVHMSFAHNLKTMCSKVFNLNDNQVDTQPGKSEQLNPPISFGVEEAIKVICYMAQTHQIEELDLEQFKTPKILNTPREVLQYVGTDICRKIIPNYHVDVVRQQIQLRPHENIILTDARFPNEREMLKREFDAILIRIKRPNFTPDVPTGHTSETSLGTDNEYDQIIINDSTLLELQKQALEFNKGMK